MKAKTASTEATKKSKTCLFACPTTVPFVEAERKVGRVNKSF